MWLIYSLGIIKMKSLKKKKIIRVNGFLMLLYKNRVVVTGGTGRFGQVLKKIKSKNKLFFPKKSELNILKVNSITKFLNLKKDDFIELEGGPSGFIVDVGWRSTKIQSRFNNLVIIPNSRLAQSIITNYSSPTPAINVRVTCGVSYESDLKQVEKIVLEIANDTIMDSPHAINENPPFFGFSEFGDSNIDFWVVIQASDRLGSFALKSTLIKNIHTRFSKEGIEINYPVRKLIGATSSSDKLEVAN